MGSRRVTYVCQHFSLPTESGNLRMWEFARRLQADGYSVTVVRGGNAAGKTTVEDVRICTVSAKYANEMSMARRILSFVQFMVGSCVLAITTKPNLIVASSTPLTVAVPAIIGGLRPRTRVIFEVRDLWPELPVKLGFLKNVFLIRMAALLEWAAYRRANAVIALSPYMEDGVKKVAPGSNTVMIPNGCDFDQFDSVGSRRKELRKSLDVADSEILIVYAGGFGFLYDLGFFVEIAGLLQGSGVRFAFIGQGSESSALKLRARTLGMDTDTLFLGRRSKREVIEYLNASDANISSLRAEPILEGCSLNKVFDAMAAGRPLLLNHGGWLADEVQEAEAGWRLPANPVAAAEYLREILSDHDELVRRGKNNYQLGRLKFSRDDQYRLFVETVEGVMGPG